MGDRRLEIGRRCHSYYCSIFPHISSGNRVQSFFVSPIKREWKCLKRYACPAMGTGGPPAYLKTVAEWDLAADNEIARAVADGNAMERLHAPCGIYGLFFEDEDDVPYV